MLYQTNESMKYFYDHDFKSKHFVLHIYVHGK